MKYESLHELYKTYKATWLEKLRLMYAGQRHLKQPGKSRSQADKTRRQKKRKRLTHSRQIRVDKELLDAMHQFVQRTSADSHSIYTSAASFMRDALAEYQQGLHMAPDTEAERKATTLRLDDELNAFWSSLPRGKRLDILQVILRLKLGGDGSA